MFERVVLACKGATTRYRHPVPQSAVNDRRALRVAVIGAGFAGLAAAEELARNGLAVAVFEARDRVGGRVWSRELSGGGLIELGAEFVEPHDGLLAATVERLGSRLCNRGIAYGDREPRGGIGVDRLTLLAAIETVQLALRDRPASARPLSVAAFLRSLPLDPGAAEAIASRIQVTFADEPEAIDASMLRGSGASFSGELSFSVEHGNQSVALKLALPLAGAVHLSSPVDRVVVGVHGVRVRAAGVEHEADACVCAVPASVIGRISFEPGLPEDLGEALGRVRYAHAAKLFVPLREPAALSATLNVPERYWSWVGSGASGAPTAIVHSFAGSASALTALGVARGPERWLESLAAFRPDLSLDPGSAVLSTWDDDPWARGVYSTVDLARPAGDDAVLRRALGPLHFAGEHTAGPDIGLMEGALKTGLRAAGEILHG